MSEFHKNAFVVYESVWDALLALPKEKQDDALWRIIDFGITGECKDADDKGINIALLPIFTGIETQKRRYRNIYYMNMIIDEVYRRFAYATDKCDLLVAQKVINSLKKIVVECQKQDLSLFQVTYNVASFLSSNCVRHKLDRTVENGEVKKDFFNCPIWKSMLNAAMEEKNAAEAKNNEKKGGNDYAGHEE